MTPFQYLILAHLLLDYPLQTEFLALGKKNYLLLLGVHVAMWSFGCLAVLNYFGAVHDWTLPWLVIGHWCMDWLKCHKLAGWLCNCAGDPLCEALGHKQNGKTPWRVDPLGLPLVIDQVFHLFQLWICLK